MKRFKDMLISLKSSTGKGQIFEQADHWEVSHTCSPCFKVGGSTRTCNAWCAAPSARLGRELMGSKGSCLQYSGDHYSVRTNRLRRKTCGILKNSTFYNGWNAEEYMASVLILVFCPGERHLVFWVMTSKSHLKFNFIITISQLFDMLCMDSSVKWSKWLLLLILINEKPESQQVSLLPEAKQTRNVRSQAIRL